MHPKNNFLKIFPFLWALVFILPLFVSAGQIDSLEKLLPAAHDSRKKIEIYTLLSKQYQPIDLDVASDYATKALAMSQKTEIDDFLAEIYGCYGDIAVMMDSLDAARNYYEISLKLFEETEDVESLAGVTMVLGNIANVQDDFALAIIYYERALAYAKEAELFSWIDNLYLNIGIINLNSGNIKKAQEYFSVSLEKAKETNDTSSMASALTNIGTTYIKFNDTILSRKYLLDGLAYDEKLNLPTGIAQAYIGLAKVESMKKNYTKAQQYLEKVLQLIQIDDPEYAGPKKIFKAVTYKDIGHNYLSLKQVNLAEEYLVEALKIAKVNGQLDITAQAIDGLSKVWEMRGRYDSAFFYQGLHKQYSDSLLNAESIRKLAYQDAVFSYEQELLEEKMLREKQAEKQKQNIRTLVAIVVGLILVLVVMILFLKLGRNRVKRIELEHENLRKELELRNKELTTHVIYQLKKNELILDISKKLSLSVSNLKPENRKIIQEVIRQLDLDSGAEMWKEFEVRFQQVHTGFYKALSTKIPDLTTNELRLCAFLRLNMNTKDISAITYQSTNSIDVARSRLRQKFGLSKDENLSGFLAQF